MKVGSLPAKVTVYEVAPRDGLQNESARVPTAEKVAFVEGLVACGLTAVEITSFVSPKWIPTLADGPEVAARVKRREGVRYSALVPNEQGLLAALAAGMREIAVFLSATESHNQAVVASEDRDEGLRAYAEKRRPRFRGR